MFQENVYIFFVDVWERCIIYPIHMFTRIGHIKNVSGTTRGKEMIDKNSRKVNPFGCIVLDYLF